MKRHRKRPMSAPSLDDVVKAMRRGNREAEREMMGPGFHAKHVVHKSSVCYSRKVKHKGAEDAD
ncbi:MAG: hypothetical protein HUK02_05045 [Bacteroidaceae bacterium]|nr:hypothetical protein [Bacteroidaceae bacterium]